MNVYEENEKALKQIADDINTPVDLSVGEMQFEGLRIELIKTGILNQIGINLGLIWEELHSISNRMPSGRYDSGRGQYQGGQAP